ncbi:MAG TPA: GlsB/YeaQ/YmgE family stress response membrane protein [Pyrinomonadaceae bacterium]|jgi:uncharacterized membrane protein YeaQ/YmgE (transglycosylase-associated protein family)
MFGTSEILWTVVSWIIFGLIVGWIARFLMSSRHTGGAWMTLLLGVGGAIIGGIIGRFIFGFGFRTGNSPEDFTLPSFLLNLLCAILGAIALSAAYRIFLDKSTADG